MRVGRFGAGAFAYLLAAAAATVAHGQTAEPSTGFVPGYEIANIVRAAGFAPQAAPLREGTIYVVRARDFRGTLMRIVVDAHSGVIRDVTQIVPGPGSYDPIGIIPPPYRGLPYYGPPPAYYGPPYRGPEVAPPETSPSRDSAIPPAPLPPPPSPPSPPAALAAPHAVATPPLPRARPAELAARRPDQDTAQRPVDARSDATVTAPRRAAPPAPNRPPPAVPLND